MKGTLLLLLLDMHQLGVGLLTLASIISLVLIVLKALGKEVESTALVWIRTWRNIQTERSRKVLIESSSESPQSLDQTRSERGLDSGDP